MMPPHTATKIARSLGGRRRPCNTTRVCRGAAAQCRRASALVGRSNLLKQLLKERDDLLAHIPSQPGAEGIVHTSARLPPREEALQRDPQGLGVLGLAEKERPESADHSQPACLALTFLVEACF